MSKYFNDFAQRINNLGRVHDLSRAFNDLLTMGICSYHQTNIQSQLQQKDEANEALYMGAIKSYKGDELNAFAECLGLLQLNVLDNPYSDLLGEFFMLEITKGQNGQYFTPDPICQMMAEMQFSGGVREGQRVLDPACGSGRMLLNAAKLHPKNHFFGGDNAMTCAKMATLNFFLNGLVGEVAWMDCLSMEWFGGWHINTNGLGILPIDKEQSQIWSEAPKPKPLKPIEDMDNEAGNPAHQLSLF